MKHHTFALKGGIETYRLPPKTRPKEMLTLIDEVVSELEDCVIDFVREDSDRATESTPAA